MMSVALVTEQLIQKIHCCTDLCTVVVVVRSCRSVTGQSILVTKVDIVCTYIEEDWVGVYKQHIK